MRAIRNEDIFVSVFRHYYRTTFARRCTRNCAVHAAARNDNARVNIRRATGRACRATRILSGNHLRSHHSSSIQFDASPRKAAA